MLLAMLASLLDPASILDQATLLDALTRCDGNVDEAAKMLMQKSVPRVAGQKRKRTAGLDGWLGSPTKVRQHGLSKPSSSGYTDVHADTIAATASKALIHEDSRYASPERQPLASSSTVAVDASSDTLSSHVKPVSSSRKRDVTNNELLSLLRPPNSKEGGKKPAQLPPLTLATPSLVEEHTPCTSHPSVLPPELACR